MTPHLDAQPLSFPVDMYDGPYAAWVRDTTLDEMVDLFGEPFGLVDPGDPGPTERWAFEYSCGLKLVYELDITSKQTLVLPDIPEIAHVMRHLPFEMSRVNPVSADELRTQIGYQLSYYPQRESEFDSLDVAQVWRHGEDGNSFTVGRPTSVRDAKCHVAELESRGHKQHYWYKTR